MKNQNEIDMHKGHKVTTLDLLKRYLSLKIQKMSFKKTSATNPNISPLDQMQNVEVNHIAIMLDGVVEDIIRTQNRLAAILLSGPTFVEFDPMKQQPQIGNKYVDGKFIDESSLNGKKD